MPASRQRKERRARERKMKSLGFDMVERIHIPKPPATVSARDRVDVIVWEVARAVKALVQEGADLDKPLAVTVGEHPSFPGGLTVEAKGTRSVGVIAAVGVKPDTDAALVAAFNLAVTATVAEDDDDTDEGLVSGP